MKFNRIAVIATVLLAAACSKENGKVGSVRFAVTSNEEVAEITKGKVSDYTTLPATASFNISIKDADNASVWSGPISGWDASTALNVGNYTVIASYGEEGIEGFDKPYFSGSSSFAVVGGNTAQVSIPVQLGNSIVKVTCSDAFKNFFTDYSFTVTTGNGTKIDFPKGETRAAFVDAFKFTIAGDLLTQGGKQQSFSREYINLEPKTCYTVSFDVDNVAGVTVTISFNDTVETVSLGDIELND
ncbi:MAG: DUF4493 domain-containing protein [Bacteroidales bacterium]|nr:DUF4493 domain-containing protein [Candidatus Cryptobacteroides caccocaballi]